MRRTKADLSAVIAAELARRSGPEISTEALARLAGALCAAKSIAQIAANDFLALSYLKVSPQWGPSGLVLSDAAGLFFDEGKVVLQCVRLLPVRSIASKARRRAIS
jgi:hypothetical protein